MGRCLGTFQLGRTGCVARNDVAVEGQAEFGVGDPSREHRCISGQAGLQLIQKAGTTKGKTTVIGVCGRIYAETVGSR